VARQENLTPPSVLEPSVAGDRPSVLVVLEDTGVRQACVQTLRELGYDVLDAPDAMDALRLIADNGGVDVLITGISLPDGVSGRALAHAAQQVDPGIKVLFCTGHAADEGEPGCDPALLPKLFTQAQLASKVRQAIQAHAPVAPPETVQG
jgi:CheY-like chemotaxis protein